MAKELRFECRMLFNERTGRDTHARILGERQRITTQEATNLLEKLENELRYAITESRIRQLQMLLNPAGIGVFQGNIGKRKYVRKGDIEVVDAEVVAPVAPIIPVDPVIPPKNIYDLLVPIGTIIATSKTSDQHDYTIIDVINNTSIKIQHNRSSKDRGYGISNYSLQTMNENILTGYWLVRNPTPEILKRIKEYTNVVKSANFKKNNASKNDDKNQNYGENFIITVGSRNSAVNIPMTPGFTGNCQLSIIGCMSTLMSKTTDLIGQLKEVYVRSGRRLLLCDIKQGVCTDLEKRIKPQAIHSKMPYTSTNGSHMVIVLINLTKL